MKGARLLLAATAALLIATPAYAEPPAFTASCPAGVTVKSNGKGKMRINGGKATVKTFNESAWEAQSNDISINVSRQDSGLLVTYTGKDGNGICRVTSTGKSGAAKSSDVPKKDRKACLAAVTDKTKNSAVEVLESRSAEANNTVIVGVGADKAKWQCLVKDGKVAGVMSLAGEGAL